MKKMIALFLLAALLLNCCVLPAFAEEEADASEPVVLIEDDMIANKGSTKSYLCSGTTWIEQDSMLELGEDAYLVYKVTAPATQGINFRVDFKNLNDDENGDGYPDDDDGDGAVLTPTPEEEPKKKPRRTPRGRGGSSPRNKVGDMFDMLTFKDV